MFCEAEGLSKSENCDVGAGPPCNLVRPRKTFPHRKFYIPKNILNDNITKIFIFQNVLKDKT